MGTTQPVADALSASRIIQELSLSSNSTGESVESIQSRIRMLRARLMSARMSGASQDEIAKLTAYVSAQIQSLERKLIEALAAETPKPAPKVQEPPKQKETVVANISEDAEFLKKMQDAIKGMDKGEASDLKSLLVKVQDDLESGAFDDEDTLASMSQALKQRLESYGVPVMTFLDKLSSDYESAQDGSDYSTAVQGYAQARHSGAMMESLLNMMTDAAMA